LIAEVVARPCTSMTHGATNYITWQVDHLFSLFWVTLDLPDPLCMYFIDRSTWIQMPSEVRYYGCTLGSKSVAILFLHSLHWPCFLRFGPTMLSRPLLYSYTWRYVLASISMTLTFHLDLFTCYQVSRTAGRITLEGWKHASVIQGMFGLSAGMNVNSLVIDLHVLNLSGSAKDSFRLPYCWLFCHTDSKCSDSRRRLQTSSVEPRI
jgi:hypothetical protein